MFHVAILTMLCCLWIMLQEVIFLPLKRWNPMQAVSDKSTVARVGYFSLVCPCTVLKVKRCLLLFSLRWCLSQHEQQRTVVSNIWCYWHLEQLTFSVNLMYVRLHLSAFSRRHSSHSPPIITLRFQSLTSGKWSDFNFYPDKCLSLKSLKILMARLAYLEMCFPCTIYSRISYYGSA